MADGVFVTLVVLYTLLGLYVLGQIVLLWQQRHKPWSYKVVFNWFALIWMLFRAIYWGMEVTGANNDMVTEAQQTWSSILLWFPHCIIYMTFATLALFFTKIIVRRQWTGKYRHVFLFVYGFLGAIDVIGTLTLAVLAGTSDDNDFVNNIGQLEALCTGLLFMILSGIYFVIAWKLRQLAQWEYNRMFVFNPRTTATVALVLALDFLTRSIFNYITYSNVFSVGIGTDETAADDAIIMMAYLLWEFAPLIALLLTIATGPVSQGAALPAKETLSFGVFGAIEAIQEHDGDDADEGLLNAEHTKELLHYAQGIPRQSSAGDVHSSGPSSSGGLGSPGGVIIHNGTAFSTSAGSARLPVASGPGAGLGRPGGLGAMAGPSSLPRSMGGFADATNVAHSHGTAVTSTSHRPSGLPPSSFGPSAGLLSPGSVPSTDPRAGIAFRGMYSPPAHTQSTSNNYTPTHGQYASSGFHGSVPQSQQLPSIMGASPMTPISGLMYEQHMHEGKHTRLEPGAGRIFRSDRVV